MVFRDGDITWHGDLPLSSHKAERLEASSFEAVDGSIYLLLLVVVEMLFGDIDGIVGADFRSITRLAGIIGGRFDFDRVDVVVHVVVDAKDVSHQACQEAC